MEEYFLDGDILNQISKSSELIQQGNSMYLKLWKAHIVFSIKWWLCIAMAVLPWTLWFRFRKKESTDRLLYSGFVVLIISSFLDFIGTSFNLWRYNVDLEPLVPSFFPWDFCILPVEAMLLNQYKPRVFPFYKAVIFAGVNAFIGETILDRLSFYEPLEWESLYSFPIYFSIFLIGNHFYKRNQFKPI
jgi:hypothetical protein